MDTHTDNNTLDFSRRISLTIGHFSTQYGIIDGSNTIVVLKTGSGGSIDGYKNKYLNLAHDLHNKYGFSVIIASSPKTILNIRKSCMDQAMSVLHQYCEERCFDCAVVLAVGISIGALAVMEYRREYPEIHSVLAVNPPLPFFKGKLRKQNGEETEDVNIVFGENDNNRKYIGSLKKDWKTEIIPNQNHLFSGEGERIGSVIDRWIEERLK